jgi:outer membrane protein
MTASKRFYSFTVVLVFGVLSSTAQASWNLQRCLDYALQHNLQVKQSELSVEQSRISRDESYASFFPSVNGQASSNVYFGRFVDPYTNLFTTSEVRSTNLGLNASMALFQGLQLQNQLSQSRLNYMASRFELEKVRNDISLNVVAAYLQVLYNQDVYDVLAGRVQATVDQRNRMKRMYELGTVSKGNYLELDAQVASDSASLVAGKAQVDQSVLSLAQLLELDSLSDFRIDRPSVDLVPELPSLLDADAVYGAALKTQPEIKGSEFRRLASEKGLSVARGARYPRLFIAGNLNTNYSSSNQNVTVDFPGTFTSTPTGFTSSGDTVFTISPDVIRRFEKVPLMDQFENNRGSGVAVSLQIPLFNNWNVRSNVARTKVAFEQSRLNEEIVRNNLYKSVQQAVLDAVSARRKFEAGTRSAESLREAAQFSRQRFELGLINSYEYAISVNNLARGEADRLQAKYDYLFRLKLLDFYQGKPLTF